MLVCLKRLNNYAHIPLFTNSLLGEAYKRTVQFAGTGPSLGPQRTGKCQHCQQPDH